MIVYKHSDSLEVHFTPLDNGRAEYLVTIHDFDNLDGWNGRVSYSELNTILDAPSQSMRLARLGHLD
jgi:hypothetical protein